MNQTKQEEPRKGWGNDDPTEVKESKNKGFGRDNDGDEDM